jgi:hypothetical protein
LDSHQSGDGKAGFERKYADADHSEKARQSRAVRINDVMMSDTIPEETIGDGPERADLLLRRFVGKQLLSVEQSEYQLRLIFGSDAELIVSSAWRLRKHITTLIGSGDSRRTEIAAHCADLLGARVVSTSVVQSWDTTLVLERDYVLEVFPDSVQYEMWEAHMDIGLIVFSGGHATFFPPASHGQSQAGGRDGIRKKDAG